VCDCDFGSALKFNALMCLISCLASTLGAVTEVSRCTELLLSTLIGRVSNLSLAMRDVAGTNAFSPPCHYHQQRQPKPFPMCYLKSSLVTTNRKDILTEAEERAQGSGVREERKILCPVNR